MNTTPSTPTFGILGARPRFNTLLVGDTTYLPAPERYESAFRDIFIRQYYTNQGPLTSQLEQRLSALHGTRHVVCVTNATIGLIMAAEAMDLRGQVIVPTLASASVLQSLAWVGLEPVFCDVDSSTHQIDVDHVADTLDRSSDEISAILAVNQWGSVCDAPALRDVARRFNTRLYFDSVQAFANVVDGSSVGSFGDVEIFSLHSGQIMGGAEGGFLCTNDDALAARLRNIRSSYGAGAFVPVAKTSNGRMSEAQAALGRLHLDDFPQMQQRNLEMFRAYEDCLEKISGLRLLKPNDACNSSYAYVICEIDETVFGMSRDRLITVLNAENINARHHPCLEAGFACIAPRSGQPYKPAEVTRHYLQLPLGADVSTRDIDQVCAILVEARTHAGLLK
jgi:dTDP-4-amino-4,6-dideoxygalactose transaminase